MSSRSRAGPRSGPFRDFARRASASADDRLARSTGSHAQGSVETDHLAVQVLVLDDVLDERGEVLRAAEPLREGDLRHEAVADVVAHRPEHRRVGGAWRDRY